MVSVLQAECPPSKLVKKNGEVLAWPGRLGERKRKAAVIKLCLRRSLQMPLTLIRCCFLQRDGGQAMRLPQSTDLGA